MSTLTLTIVIVFVIGYMCIALETLTKVNKAAVALLMMVACWTLYMFDPGNFPLGVTTEQISAAASAAIEGHLGSTATTLFFLMGAMTIVETVDQNGGFNFVRDMMKTKSKKALLWRITILTFFLSAILDNMTTAIVMVMILRKLIDNRKDRLIYASLIIIAANSGGAFSPIGDVTTIMLWNKSLITAAGVIKEPICLRSSAYCSCSACSGRPQRCSTAATVRSRSRAERRNASHTSYPASTWAPYSSSSEY